MTQNLVWSRLPLDGGFVLTTRFGEVLDRGIHLGVDFAVAEGTPVYAPADGRVTEFTNDGTFGIGVCLDHEATPWYSLFAHLQSAAVSLGTLVRSGELVGYTGSTGLSSGPHLHWQVGRLREFPRDVAAHVDPFFIPIAWAGAGDVEGVSAVLVARALRAAAAVLEGGVS